MADTPNNTPPDEPPGESTAAQTEAPAVRDMSGDLPFSLAWPILAGAITGVALRFIFSGKPGGFWAPMMGSFIFLCPVLVGAVTVFLAERQCRNTWYYYVIASGSASGLFVLGTVIIMIEGMICAIVILPLAFLFGIAGGLLMGVVCRATNWPKHTLGCLAVLPLVLGGLEGFVDTPTRLASIKRTVLIQATPDKVWRQLMDARDIKPDEMRHAWIFRIGVPLPLAGVVTKTPEGLVRKMTMGKDVHFDQVSNAWQENRYVHWKYRLYPDSFPPYALDDHVVVGGYYFDITDTVYELAPQGNATQLRIRMRYRVTTQFNWYAEPLARYLLGNFEEIVLDFYRRRSEAPPVPTAGHNTRYWKSVAELGYDAIGAAAHPAQQRASP